MLYYHRFAAAPTLREHTHGKKKMHLASSCVSWNFDGLAPARRCVSSL